MSPVQCRAARSLLRWTQEDLADHAQVGIVSVRQFEAEAVEPRRATLAALRRALEVAGIVFIEQNGGGPGVRLRDRQPTSKKG
jgi:transcriptional regulator with XRE-family HTH domain